MEHVSHVQIQRKGAGDQGRTNALIGCPEYWTNHQKVQRERPRGFESTLWLFILKQCKPVILMSKYQQLLGRLRPFDANIIQNYRSKN